MDISGSNSALACTFDSGHIDKHVQLGKPQTSSSTSGPTTKALTHPPPPLSLVVILFFWTF